MASFHFPVSQQVEQKRKKKKISCSRDASRGGHGAGAARYVELGWSRPDQRYLVYIEHFELGG